MDKIFVKKYLLGMRKFPKIASSRVLYKGYISLREDEIINRDGKHSAFNVVQTPGDAVTVLAILGDGNFVICAEYRHGIGDWVYTLPGGNVDPGENPLEAGKRELLEETGYRAKNFKELAIHYPCPAILNQKVHVLTATGAELAGFPSLEPAEWIETHTMSENEVYALIADGAMVDSVLIAGLFHYRLTLL